MLTTADSEWQYMHVFFHMYNTNLNSFVCMYVCTHAYMGVAQVERYQEEGRIDIIGSEGAGESM